MWSPSQWTQGDNSQRKMGWSVKLATHSLLWLKSRQCLLYCILSWACAWTNDSCTLCVCCSQENKCCWVSNLHTLRSAEPNDSVTFLQLRGWRIGSSETWRYVTGYWVPDLSRNHIALTFGHSSGTCRTLSHNIENPLPSDVVSYPGRTDT
jgi:hypothetical protein